MAVLFWEQFTIPTLPGTTVVVVVVFLDIFSHFSNKKLVFIIIQSLLKNFIIAVTRPLISQCR